MDIMVMMSETYTEMEKKNKLYLSFFPFKLYYLRVNYIEG